MPRTVVDVGPSSLRVFGYEPAGMQQGDSIVCVDMPYEAGTLGVSEAKFGSGVPIFPTSQAAEDAIERARQLGEVAANDSGKWECEKFIRWAGWQVRENRTYELLARRYGVWLRALHGDGRNLIDALHAPADEVLLHNVVSDPKVNERDSLQLLYGALRAIKPGGKVVLHDAYTPEITRSRLYTFKRHKLLGGVTLQTEYVVDGREPPEYGCYRFSHQTLGYHRGETLRTVLTPTTSSVSVLS